MHDLKQEDSLLVDAHQPPDALSEVFHDAEQRCLVDGFVATRNGCYPGPGTGQALLRGVTEWRIEAACHADPLTFLSGNIPITAHVDTLMREGTAFVVAYVDLNSNRSTIITGTSGGMR